MRLETIADVRDQAGEQRAAALLDGKPVIGFEIVRSWGASALDVREDSRVVVAKLAKEYPKIHFAEASSTVGYIQTSYDASMEMLVEGAILAILVVWLFLRDWRATAVSAIALPLSIIPTFWAMALGFTLNILTMLALTLVVGILVDDAIVEVENIVRHLRMGKKPKAAAMDAAIEIGLAVVATTLTICAVFIPVAFMSGIAGQFFRPFGFTVTVAVLFSLLVARTLTPMMAAYMLKPHEERPSKRRAIVMPWYLGRVRWCLENRWKTLGAATLIIGSMLAVFPLLSTAFSPAGDNGFTRLTVELAPGSSLEDTVAVAETVRKRLAAMPDVGSVYTAVGTQGRGSGFGGGGAAGSVRRASLTIQINNPKGTRGAQQAFERKATAILRDVPGARIQFDGNDADRLSVTLSGDDGGRLAFAAANVEREMRQLPGLGTITSSAALQKPEIVITPMPERAAELGVATEALSAATRIATSGDVSTLNLPKFNLPERQVPIRVRLNDAARGDIDSIRSMLVPGRAGLVPLENIAKVTFGAGPTSIERYDRSRNVTISADLGGAPLGDVLKKVESMPAMAHLPDGVERRETGDVRASELFGGFLGAMGVGLLCIYAVLVLLFHDFIQPLTILARASAVRGRCARGSDLPGLRAVAALAHRAPDADGHRDQELDPAGGVRDHGPQRSRHGAHRSADRCLREARPAHRYDHDCDDRGHVAGGRGFSADPSFRAPMGIAVIGGLITSTALSLFVVPSFFSVFDDFQQWLSRKWGQQHTEEDGTVPTQPTGAAL